MVTISDVAKQANVSKMTVSRVLNHPEQVRDDLKKLVYEAMEQLNYVPNYAARALVSNRTQVIKFLILEEMDTTEPYYMNLLAGIARELDQNHYSLQLVTRKSKDIGQCDGVIATGVRSQDYDTILKEFSKPVILFGQNDRGFDFIDVDNEKGVRLLTEHVIRRGFKKFIFSALTCKSPLCLRDKKVIWMQPKQTGCRRFFAGSKTVQAPPSKKRKKFYPAGRKDARLYAQATGLPSV